MSLKLIINSVIFHKTLQHVEFMLLSSCFKPINSVKHSMPSADVVRTVLPNIIPPSYKGATIRYFYYVKTTFFGQWLVMENGHSHRESVKDPTELVGFL
jgi:hypothetical protein